MVDGSDKQPIESTGAQGDQPRHPAIDGGALLTSPEIRGTARESSDQSRKDSLVLAQAGTIPDVSLEPEGQAEHRSLGDRLTDALASEEDKKIFDEYDRLAARCGLGSLTPGQKLEIEGLSPDMKEMYHKTIRELTDLKDGKINPAEYFANTLSNAADLAEANGREPGSWNIFKRSQESLFRDYTGLVLSEKPMGFFRDRGRELVGGGPDYAGSALEHVYQSIVGTGRAGEGFNSNVADVNPTNSITHHYREFLLVGYNAGKLVGDSAATFIDDPKKNPGDVRCGFFASMVGQGLALGMITAREAADMTTWAYTSHDGTQPPWGAAGTDGAYLDPGKDYDIRKWLKAFLARER
ncbi:MAG: hypothetical protein IPM23_05930 [Candidatus Melainabacteria bacterium]|nr:hypothetical protein [Candidatus Melainabacteria bacterium]